ncbi:Carboxypeptidase regulatory-like domain-containing protein [Dyella jiangningensis]|uniref:TonB-dependent receptor n=1 Tax=Dyella sp. AtDHG13 TaxID=1938897 RepID=UPI00088D357C|nr:TonB-dependent receptor [Dyella sp. AtDHG13]PXV58239.1 carboxypeptidase family protein [Dyella sp. AtDHG13]SDK10654.1 Carboxypeptidase regulatory-like domain-containing protein [Dyella jiangningensis]
MNHSLRTKLLPVAIATLLATAPAFAQDTSSSISGRIVDGNGQPIAGATVQIVHEPTGTTKTTTTDAAGRYAAQGLRVGGPFDVKVSKDGTETEQDNVYLQLAQDTAVNLTMGVSAATANAQNLSGVTVSANALSQTFTPDNKGISTNISRRELDAAPTPGRSIQNIVRMDPRVVITDRARGEISAIGQNSRYNNITVDSVSANDPFGLNANGLPTLGTPISQDTIEEYNISTANYDVATRRGLGANINAVTKSGTNNFHGSVYYAFQNTDMIGDNEQDKPYAGFNRQWTGGATLGGPIIKDKLFFFTSVEKSEQVGSGSPYGPADSNAATPVKNLTSAQVQQIRDIAAKQYGLTDIGSVGGGNSNLVDKRYLAKIDWNITDNHRASFTYSQTKENKPIITGSTTKLVLSSGWYKTNVDNKSYALHFYDDWSDIFSTDTTVSYADFNQNRGPYNGVAMPDITIYPAQFNGGSAVEFGTEYSSQANVLKVKTFNAAFAGTLYLGDHTLKGGFDYEKDKYYNLFLQNYYGSYTFEDLTGGPSNGIDAFAQGKYYQYRYNRPADGLSLDDVAARYNLNQWGVFLQDTWQVTNNLSLQYGVRVDIPLMSDKPLYNKTFAQSFSYADGTPRNNQVNINGNRVVQPRMSFNYNFDTEHMMQLRGGAGLFVTNTPGVWVGNIFSNSGVTQTQYNCGPTQNGCKTNLPPFSPDPFHQNNGASGSGQMTVNSIEPGFRIPTAWKFSLGFDKELPWYGLIATADYQHIKQRDAIWYQNLNIGAPTGVLPDGRFTYYKLTTMDPKATGQVSRANANTKFSDGTINLANTNKGSADSITLALKKPFADDWQAMVGFTWSRATEVNPGTSSVARSNWANNYVMNPNENVASNSNYSIPRRVIASLTWQHRFFGDYATSVSAFYDGHNAAPFSWTFGNDANGDGFTNDLVYIPRPGEVEFGYRDAKGNIVAADQKLVQQFYNYVQGNDYLKDHQGSVAKRNGDRAGWINQIDLSFSQEIPGIFKGNKGEIRFDVYNFTNLLNKHWGIEKRVNFPGGRPLADFAGVDPKTGKYLYDITCGGKLATCTNYINNGNYSPQAIPTYINNNDDLAQRWSVLLTLKYKF